MTSSVRDDSYTGYDSRAAALLPRLDSQPSDDDKAADLAARLVSHLGTGSPRLISAVHEAEAHLKRFDPSQRRDLHTGEWSTGGGGSRTPAASNPRFSVGRPVGPGRTWGETQTGDQFDEPTGKKRTVADVLAADIVFTEGGRVPKHTAMHPALVYRGQKAPRRPYVPPPDSGVPTDTPDDLLLS